MAAFKRSAEYSSQMFFCNTILTLVFTTRLSILQLEFDNAVILIFLKTVYEFIQKENPAVIVAGSGGFADVLAAASIEEQELTEDLVYLLMEGDGV